MRLYRSLKGITKSGHLKPYHHIKLPRDVLLDLQIWQIFLDSLAAFCRPFIDFDEHVSAEEIDWCTDSAKAINKGFGGDHLSHWFAGLWDESFLKHMDPSIEFLELYAVAVSVLLWLKLYKDKRLVLWCDNQSVVFMLNNQSSKCKNCMTPIRIVTLECLNKNVRLYG